MHNPVLTWFSLVLFTLTSSAAFSSVLTPGGQAPKVVLSKDEGGYVGSEKAFDSSSLAGKLQVIWYVDPDERELNKYAQDKLRAANFPDGSFTSVAIVNFAATFIPNFILRGLIEDSQKENKNTIYVRDLNKVFVKQWGLKDDSSNVIVLSKDQKVLYSFGGKMDEKETEKLLSTIRTNI